MAFTQTLNKGDNSSKELFSVDLLIAVWRIYKVAIYSYADLIYKKRRKEK